MAEDKESGVGGDDEEAQRAGGGLKFILRGTGSHWTHLHMEVTESEPYLKKFGVDRQAQRQRGPLGSWSLQRSSKNNHGETGVGKSPLCSHHNKDWMRCTPSIDAKSREKF